MLGMKRFVSTAAATIIAAVALGQAVPVQVVVNDGVARFVRDGETVRVQGAGGQGPLDELAAAGANATRTWSVDDAQAFLDDAHANGLMVSLGIWLGHERHGFDYSDPQQTAAQLEKVRHAVLAFRDHPAVLVWALGNEMEGFGAGDNDLIWQHVEHAAAIVKSLDPNHPTMTVIAEVGGARIPSINQFCPSIDVVGINSYAGARTIPQRYRDRGGVKPYLITEFGARAPQDSGRTPWGRPIEPTSTTKAAMYTASFNDLTADPLCMGTIAFSWGSKRQGSITWHGMMLDDGAKVESIDAMTAAWGEELTNECPEIASFTTTDDPQLEPGETFTAQLAASDPDGDPLTYEYRLYGEISNSGDNNVPFPTDFSAAITSSGPDGVTLVAPTFDGPLRLYVFVRDGKEAAATANIPIFIEGGAVTPDPFRVDVYSDTATETPWVASGRQGDVQVIEMDFDDASNPRSGPTACRVTFNSATGFGAGVWQNPANNFGDMPGGVDLSGMTVLRFWARGAVGGEVVRFGYGYSNGRSRPFPDSSRMEMDVTLSDEWTEYTMSLEGANLSSIVSGFHWIVQGPGAPITFYLDDIRFETCRRARHEFGSGAFSLTSLINAIAAGSLSADLNGDEAADALDMVELLESIEQTCP